MNAAVREAAVTTTVVDADRVRRIVDAAGDRSGQGAWAAVLAAGGASALPGGDHANWLPESLELWWRAPVGDNDIEVRVDVVLPPHDTERALVRTTGLIDGDIVADVILHARLRSSTRSRTSLRPLPRSGAAEAWTRIITDEQVHGFCAAVGTPSWSTAGLSWAAIPSRPQPVVPVSLLVGEAARLLPVESGALAVDVHTPVLAGALLHWARSESRVWVGAPDAAPALQFELDA